MLSKKSRLMSDQCDRSQYSDEVKSVRLIKRIVAVPPYRRSRMTLISRQDIGR